MSATHAHALQCKVFKNHDSNLRKRGGLVIPSLTSQHNIYRSLTGEAPCSLLEARNGAYLCSGLPNTTPPPLLGDFGALLGDFGAPGCLEGRQLDVVPSFRARGCCCCCFEARQLVPVAGADTTGAVLLEASCAGRGLQLLPVPSGPLRP